MERRRHTLKQETAIDAVSDPLRPVWLGAFISLCVATPILPTETVSFGGSLFLVMLLWWLLFLAWSLTGAARQRLQLRMGKATWLLIAFLVWHGTSALVMSRHGNPRAAINVLWLWATFGIAFFLARQLVVT